MVVQLRFFGDQVALRAFPDVSNNNISIGYIYGLSRKREDSSEMTSEDFSCILWYTYRGRFVSPLQPEGTVASRKPNYSKSPFSLSSREPLIEFYKVIRYTCGGRKLSGALSNHRDFPATMWANAPIKNIVSLPRTAVRQNTARYDDQAAPTKTNNWIGNENHLKELTQR